MSSCEVCGAILEFEQEFESGMCILCIESLSDFVDDIDDLA